MDPGCNCSVRHFVFHGTAFGRGAPNANETTDISLAEIAAVFQGIDGLLGMEGIARVGCVHLRAVDVSLPRVKDGPTAFQCH